MDSLIPQMNERTELVLIDDGSQDESFGIIQNKTQNCKNIRVYNKPNGGVSSARNFGLHFANGEYITFVDADDYVESDYIDKVLLNIEEMNSKDLDLMIFGFYHRVGDACFKNYALHRESQEEILRDIFSQRYNAPWNKIFKRSVIDEHGIKFPAAVKTSEDLLFLLDYVRYVRNVGIAGDCLIYNYCDNTDGAVHNVKEQYLIDTVRAYHKILLIMQECTINCINDVENEVMERYYYIAYNLIKHQYDKKKIRLTLYDLNADLKQMTTLTLKNRIKRFLVQHQLYSAIEHSIK